MGSDSSISTLSMATLISLFAFAIVFVHMFAACRSWREVFASTVLLAIFLVCYGDHFVVLAARGFGADTSKMQAFLESARSSVLGSIPRFGGVHIGNHAYWGFGPTDHFSCGSLAAYLLLLCYLVRTVLVRYVAHVKLRRVGREYWLYIALYLVLVAVMSEISTWNFVELLVLSVLIIAAFVGLVLRLGLDTVRAIWSGTRLLWRAVRIGFMYVALVGARIARALRNSLRWFRSMYERLIVHPIVTLGAFIRRALDHFEALAKERLDKEKLDD